jgi:hypothetical protein
MLMHAHSQTIVSHMTSIPPTYLDHFQFVAVRSTASQDHVGP